MSGRRVAGAASVVLVSAGVGFCVLAPMFGPFHGSAGMDVVLLCWAATGACGLLVGVVGLAVSRRSRRPGVSEAVPMRRLAHPGRAATAAPLDPVDGHVRGA